MAATTGRKRRKAIKIDGLDHKRCKKRYRDTIDGDKNNNTKEATMKQVIKEKHYKSYVVRWEKVTGDEAGGLKFFVTQSAYTPEGHYIGNPKIARFLCVKMGIKPELLTKKSRVCSIGYSEKDGKWYGWSHRAIYGFAIGDTVKEGDCVADYLPVGFTAKTKADCKKMAIAFARSVS